MAVDLGDKLKDTSFVFRGYNVTNLGRTRELLEHPVYGEVMRRVLKQAAKIASEQVEHKIDLIARVQANEETTLDTFADAVALIMAAEVAQIKILKEFFGVDLAQARMSIGYSLGEITALVCSGVYKLEDALRLPVSMAADCAELGKDVMMGIIFSRGAELELDDIRKLCVEINCEQRGFIGISSILSPNSLLMLGQGDTIDRFKAAMKDRFPKYIHLRKNRNFWPPMHTSIMWQKNIPNRAAVMAYKIPGGLKKPKPPILSLVTGEQSYNEFNSREILIRWTDQPQRVWNGVYETLRQGIERVIHVGPQPNLIPATFKRLSDNVQTQTSGTSPGSLGMRVVSGMARRPWLTTLLPSRTALLRAPFVEQIILEDWLLEQTPE